MGRRGSVPAPHMIKGLRTQLRAGGEGVIPPSQPRESEGACGAARACVWDPNEPETVWQIP
jgi:hypothetical protein